MKRNIKKIIFFALMLSLLIGTMVGFNAFAAEETAIEIISNNVFYGDTLNLMYAVRTTDENVVLNIYDANNNLVETITESETATVKGETAKVFISSKGVPAQNIDNVFYAQAVASDGTKSAMEKYSVLEYLYERLTVSENVSDAQKTMYNNLLAFADSADIVVNGTPAEESIANYSYIRVENGTVDGTYAAAMLMAGTKLDALTTDFVAGSGMELAWNIAVEGVDTVVKAADVADYAIEGGKFYAVTATEVDGEAVPEPIDPIVTTTDYDFSKVTGSVQYAEESHALDENVTLYVKDCHVNGELRIYSSSTNNGVAIIKSVVPISKITMNAGNKADVLVVYGSNDEGATWDEIAEITTESSYADYTEEFDSAYSWVKLDVKGTNQVRLNTITLTTISYCMHTNTTDTTVDPTCLADGYTLTKCNDCGAVINKVAGEVATGHIYDDGVVTTPASCLLPGIKTFSCIGCDVTKTEGIEALGHTTDNGFCTRCEEEVGDTTPEPVIETLATFTLGADGSASHSDGTEKSSYTETNNGITLTLSGMSKVYGGARDAKGNSALKLGTSSATGKFSFTVDANVTEVVIYVAKYKTNTTKVKINGTTHTITGSSNNGEYDAITIDTSVNKTVTFETVSGGVRCMVNTIEFKGIKAKSN